MSFSTGYQAGTIPMVNPMLKTYNVALEEGVDYDAFWDEIENNGSGSTYVPYRSVNVIKERESSLRQCWYELTDEEAEKLRADARVYCVEIPIDLRDDVALVPCATQRGLYFKNGDSEAPSNNLGVNWGLFRMNSTTNNTPGTGSGTLDYNYALDGTGVDFVIMDGGIQADHPEFQDANGTSRVQQIDWFSASGVSGTMPPLATFYTDYQGHGTHCAGVAAGKTYGRAKNARIYCMTINILRLDPTTYISSLADAWDCIKGWHRNKPIDPATGYKRPTVVSMSWKIVFTDGLTNISGGNYRGTSWTGSSSRLDYGMIGSNGDGTGFGGSYQGVSEGVDIAELLAEGVVLVSSAGNFYDKIDVPGGVDYDNYWTSSLYGPRYYHRGNTPSCYPGVIVVGAVQNQPDSPENKLFYSQPGPRVDVYAPGAAVVSSCSTNTVAGSNTYPSNTSYKITSLWGTSVACPQIAGLVAQFLQVYPQYTPAQIRQVVIDTSTLGVLNDSGLSNDYANNVSLLGGGNRFAYMPFNTATNCNTAGPMTMNNITILT